MQVILLEKVADLGNLGQKLEGALSSITNRLSGDTVRIGDRLTIPVSATLAAAPE
jgi:hypothetical protein